jgi:hypothetical protein
VTLGRWLLGVFFRKTKIHPAIHPPQGIRTPLRLLTPSIASPFSKQHHHYSQTRRNLPVQRTQAAFTMQPLVNYGHTTCPACQATISSGGKTCSACGATCPN